MKQMLLRCFTCKRDIPEEQVAYRIGTRDSGLGMCLECVRTDSESPTGAETDEEDE